MATKRKKSGRRKKKNYFPTYIITSILVTVLLVIFMYVNCGEGGIVNMAVKNFFCGLFGFCGMFVPIIAGAATVYLIAVKDIRRFWIKLGLALLILINVSALVNLSSYNDINTAFYFGYADYSGGGLLGACVSVFMEKMVQKIASYIILSITLIALASCITEVSFITEIGKWLKKTFLNVKDRYSDYVEERERRADEAPSEEENEYYSEDYPEDNRQSGVLDAANSFAEDNRDKIDAEKNRKANTDNNTDSDFSNGIDEIFGKMQDAATDGVRVNIVTDKSDGGNTEKAQSMSEGEKSAFNAELNEAIEQPAAEYKFPPVRLLKKPAETSGDKRDEMRRTAEKLISVLDNFNVKAKLLQVTQGPTVTRYEIQPDTGVKLSKIVGLADDIALNLAVTTVLVAPVPGKAAVGVDIPNNTVKTVSIREMIESAEFKNGKSRLTVALGKDIGGKVVIGDIAKMPHLLIAGATGSGKSVCINTIIMSILYKAKPEEVKLIMVDPKRVELGVYNGIPHLLIPVVTDPKKAAGALNWAVSEMMRRYDLLNDNNVRKLESYNKLMEKTGGEKLPQLVIIVDELADLMMVSAKEIEDYIVRLTQLARAAGIYLIIATQRPSVDVITGLIKANVPSRIAFAVSSQVDSRTILDRGGAEKLLGMGDMLYHPAGSRNATRVQGAFVSDSEIEKVLSYIKDTVGETHYSEDLAEEIERCATGENGVTPDTEEDGDELLPEAVNLAMSLGKISTSMIQRRLGVGYSRAGRIIDQMETRGIISGANGSKPRDVLVSHADINTADGDDEYGGE